MTEDRCPYPTLQRRLAYTFTSNGKTTMGMFISDTICHLQSKKCLDLDGASDYSKGSVKTQKRLLQLVVVFRSLLERVQIEKGRRLHCLLLSIAMLDKLLGIIQEVPILVRSTVALPGPWLSDKRHYLPIISFRWRQNTFAHMAERHKNDSFV
jgi:hypothetical protein